MGLRMNWKKGGGRGDRGVRWILRKLDSVALVIQLAQDR